MKKWTYEKLVVSGKKIENAKIEFVSLNMGNHGCLTFDISLQGNGWYCVFGGYCLGKGILERAMIALKDTTKDWKQSCESWMLLA